MSVRSKPPAKRGRPTKHINLDVLRGLASIQCTEGEMAAALGMTPRCFLNHKNADPRIGEIIAQGAGLGVVSIKRQQFKMMHAGNATIGIWLGKVYANQRERAPIQGNDRLQELVELAKNGPAPDPPEYSKPESEPAAADLSE